MNTSLPYILAFSLLLAAADWVGTGNARAQSTQRKIAKSTVSGVPSRSPLTSVHSQPITPAQLLGLVKEAKVIKPGAQLTVSTTGQEALVWTDKDPKVVDNDLKIDAMLISKAIVEGYPTVKQVKVLYSAPGKTEQVTVSADNVKAFSSHSITADQLLQSLDVTSAASLTSGPFREKRLELLGRIDSLRERGTGVKPFQTLFQSIGTMAENGAQSGSDGKVLDAIKDLSAKLSEQEDLIKQAEITTKVTKGLPGSALAGEPASVLSRNSQSPTRANYTNFDNSGHAQGPLDPTPEQWKTCTAIMKGIEDLKKANNPKAMEFQQRHEEVKNLWYKEHDRAVSLNNDLFRDVNNTLEHR